MINEQINIKVDGRTVIMKQRGKASIWYIRLQDAGADRLWSLKTSKLELAKPRAKLRCRKLWAELFAKRHGMEFNGGVEKQISKLPSAGQVYDEYCIERVKLGVSYPKRRIARQSVARNLSAFAEIIQAAFPRRDWRKVNMSELYEDKVAIAWRIKRYLDKGLDYAKEEDLALNTTINSRLAQGRSIAGEACDKIWIAKGWEVPLSIFPGDRLDEADSTFIPIPSDKDKLMEHILQNPNHKDFPGAEIAVVASLARFCGMTRSEIYNLQWNWIKESGEQLFIDISRQNDFKTKRGTKDRRIELDKNRFNYWKQLLGFDGQDVIGR